MKRSPLKRRTRKPSKAEKEARQRFREEVLSAPCLFSQTRPAHTCDGELDPHHLIKAQWLRGTFATYGPEKWFYVFAPEIGVPICRAAHDLVTNHATYVFADEVPARAFDWADELGIGWKLREVCPSLSGTLSRS